MKLITLNTWGGQVEKPLIKFFEDHQDVDIFCLQEVFNNVPEEEIIEDFKTDLMDLYSRIQDAMPNHVGYFRPQIKNFYGLAIFVKKGIVVETEGDIFIHEVQNYVTGPDHPRTLQYVSFVHSGRKFLVSNVHGLWTDGTKLDTPERIDQSERIRKFLEDKEGAKILCGDFNLEPTTKSLAILEDGYKNLVKDYGITSTRTGYFKRDMKFADYVFCSPDVEVVDFKVLPDEISDHSPLLLEF